MARNKGKMNKTTRMLLDAIILAAEEAGEEITPGHPSGKLVSYLKHSAKTQPAAFVGLLGRVLPLNMSDNTEEAPPVVNIHFSDKKVTT